MRNTSTRKKSNNKNQSSCWRHWKSKNQISLETFWGTINIKLLWSEWIPHWKYEGTIWEKSSSLKLICWFQPWQIALVFCKYSNYRVRGHNHHCCKKLIFSAKYPFTSLVLWNVARNCAGPRSVSWARLKEITSCQGLNHRLNLCVIGIGSSHASRDTIPRCLCDPHFTLPVGRE